VASGERREAVHCLSWAAIPSTRVLVIINRRPGVLADIMVIGSATYLEELFLLVLCLLSSAVPT